MVENPARGRLVAALAFIFATASIAPAASATLTVGKAAPNADPIIPVNVGEQLGIFKKHGLDLKIVDFTGGSKMTQAMAAGALDIGDGAGTEMALVAKGAPMIAICETAGPIPFIGIGVPWDSPIKTIDQLKGKKIGYSSAGSLTDWLTRSWRASRAGLPRRYRRRNRQRCIEHHRRVPRASHRRRCRGDLAVPRHGGEQDRPAPVSGEQIRGQARRRHAVRLEPHHQDHLTRSAPSSPPGSRR